MRRPFLLTVIFSSILFLPGCNSNTKSMAEQLPGLKRGEIVVCGPQDGELFGNVSFSASIPASLRNDFNIGIALLHSFEYDEAEKMFAKVIDGAPECAMAYWGVAMSNFHPLWAPPLPDELKKGKRAVDIARSIKTKTEREAGYIEAVGQFYDNAEEIDHRSRLAFFEQAMEKMYLQYPDDREAAVFYTLALNAAADPKDKTYSKQRKAFSILNQLFEKDPLHPGVAHYMIHNYDNPELASLALPAAKRYAGLAPASAHAQHMPSHIFTRLGLWDECIRSNKVSVDAAQCYADRANIQGHWDEELHGLDYLVYSYLQARQDSLAKQQVQYLHSMEQVVPMNFKVAYAFAAIPARYALERKKWDEASVLPFHPAVPWEKFPWQKAVLHFAKALGKLQSGDLPGAQLERDTLNQLYSKLSGDKTKSQEASQVLVQLKATEAWIHLKKGDQAEARRLMTEAADLEDATEKHPVTPGAVIPARELLGEMLMAMNEPLPALEAFRINLAKNPNRRNGLAGAALAMEKAGLKDQAQLAR